MARDQIMLTLQGIMRDIFDEDDLVIGNDTTADDVAEWDSINHVRLCIAAEAAFNVRFDASEIHQPGNVGEFVDLIEKKMAG
jgi:acyl carrier protein